MRELFLDPSRPIHAFTRISATSNTAHSLSDPLETEALLVEAARSGDHAAFGELVDRYHERIYSLAASFVGDADDADDVAQEIFVKVYGALGSFRGQSQFYTWLYRIAMNACLDWVKSRSRRQDGAQRVRDEGPDAPQAAGMGAAAPPADAQVERRELRAVLQRALEELPDEFRAAVVLRELQGLSYEEIGQALECSIGTVKSRLFRARAQLQAILAKDVEGWS